MAITNAGGARRKRGILGETCVAGDWAYRKKSDGRLWKAQADGTSDESQVVGILISGGTAGTEVLYYWEGDVDIGGATVAGQNHWIGATAGVTTTTAPVSTQWVTHVAIGLGSQKLRVKINRSGIQVP